MAKLYVTVATAQGTEEYALTLPYNPGCVIGLAIDYQNEATGYTLLTNSFHLDIPHTGCAAAGGSEWKVPQAA